MSETPKRKEEMITKREIDAWIEQNGPGKVEDQGGKGTAIAFVTHACAMNSMRQWLKSILQDNEAGG